MAKLHNYYILCPLIDQKSFLGVAEDREDEHVIVTLGRNVVNKYRLSDQKQVSGWTSRDHITAPVIYDATQDKYVGVFNNNTLKSWDGDSTNLDKLKKFKFPINILKLIPRETTAPLVVFTNGNSASLPYAIDNRKTYESKSLLRDTDKIVDLSCWKLNATDYICYVIKSEDVFEIVSCSLRDELGDLDKSNFNREKITRSDGAYVVGELVHKQHVIGTVPWIGTTSTVSIATMGKNHLILFGSNKNQEGAIIVAYNYSLGVGSCRYPMKMYRENAKVYCYHKRIVLEASNHIGMLPFTLESKRNLSSLLGSHEIIIDEKPEVADWNLTAEPVTELTTLQENATRLGITERKACAQIIPDLIQNDEYEQLVTLLEEFNDLPESVMGTLFRYATRRLNPKNLDITKKEFKESIEHTDEDNFKLLNSIFKITVCDALVIPHLREALTIDESLFILWYIARLLFQSEEPLDLNEESRLCDWLTLIMDAFYQQYLISKDVKVTEVLSSVRRDVGGQIRGLNSCSEVIAELQKMKTTGKKQTDAEQYYTIEIMNL
ncbi:Nucleolar protein 11 [Operophtera brumata]|uniref:Nucleolar protein 11 n=1 Tax=Operophtera brumata TaxID=104452 RepID=A0A0L7L6G2_OPEBR|nr:Nucleolar protein 11 [Operophtera brumata]